MASSSIIIKMSNAYAESLPAISSGKYEFKNLNCFLTGKQCFFVVLNIPR